ncbi:hypothetical protein GGR57DRAFT_500819 [Xylariaceae sp. FL1272]|nr:hypothetical protein GGR57DRAFT_500819 [Xylariaceae sp. FL1272]
MPSVEEQIKQELAEYRNGKPLYPKSEREAARFYSIGDRLAWDKPFLCAESISKTVPLGQDEIDKRLRHYEAKWSAGFPPYDEFHRVLTEVQRIIIPGSIDKVYCLGHGSFGFETPRMSETVHVNSILQHLASRDISQVFQSAGKPPIQILSQEPDYNDEDKKPLRSLNIKIVPGNGTLLFDELTDKSCLFFVQFQGAALHVVPELPMKPAVILCDIRVEDWTAQKQRDFDDENFWLHRYVCFRCLNI